MVARQPLPHSRFVSRDLPRGLLIINYAQPPHSSTPPTPRQTGILLQPPAPLGNSRWLIIFDNIDQYSPFYGPIGDTYDIAEFFPGADNGSILIASRLQGLTDLGKSFPIHRLNSKDAIQLLLQSSRHTAKGLESNPDTVALASRLDGLPLAIVIAGAFMCETGTSITEYLQYYQDSWSDLQLQSNPERHSNLRIWLERTISSELAFKISVKSLIGFSLPEIKEQGGYAIHPVVQDWCINLASIDKTVNSIQLNELALVSVGYTVPSEGVRNYSDLQQQLIPHANYVRHMDWSGHNIAVWGAFHGLGSLYSDQGKLKEAEEMYERALAGKEKALGSHHISTLETVNNLGTLYSYQGKLKEAEEMYQRALAGFKKALGPHHTSTLSTVYNLGNLYSDQGKLKEAEEMYKRALAGYEKALGPDHSRAWRLTER